MVNYTNEQLKKDLKLFLTKVQKKYPLKKALLFGSRARGDYFLDSDVDVILVSEHFAGRATERMSDVIPLWTASVDIEPLCYTPEEFNKKKKQIGLVQQAIKEGRDVTAMA